MDAQLKAKWLADLRSGKYAQARDTLHDRQKRAYCCLGVLCLSAGASFDDIAFAEDEETPRNFENVPVLNGQNIGFGEDPELSREFMADIGLTKRQQEKLIKMNDSGDSFLDIADYIERNI